MAKEDSPPLLEILPGFAYQEARELYSAAMARGMEDLRAMNGHLDSVLTTLLTLIERGHHETKPLTEKALAYGTGLTRESVRRRLDSLIELGEVRRIRFKRNEWPRPYIVYIINPDAANHPIRIWRVRDAIKRHWRQMKDATEAMSMPGSEQIRPLLPANGQISHTNLTEETESKE